MLAMQRVSSKDKLKYRNGKKTYQTSSECFRAPLWHSVLLLYLSPALHRSPPLPLCPVALLCSLNRNDSLYRWINKDYSYPVTSQRNPSLPHPLFFNLLLFLCHHIFLNTFTIFSSSQSAHIFFSHPVCYLHLAVADSQCTFIAHSFAKSASSIQVLSAWVLYCVYCAQVLAFFFLCVHVCRFVDTHSSGK